MARVHPSRFAAVLLLASWPGALLGEEQPPPAPVRPDDQRRTIHDYPTNLLHNMARVIVDSPWPLAVGAGLAGGAALLDDEVIDYFARHPHENWADIGRTLGGSVVVGGLTLGFFSAGRIARGGRFRAATYDVSQAIIVNFTYTFAIKAAVGRQRPNSTNQLSFPSGHTSNAFAGASVIGRHYGWKLAVPAYAVATYIGVSRLAANAHHFSDVMAGAALGFTVGRAVVRHNAHPPHDASPAETSAPAGARLDLLPDGGPAADGIGLRLVVAF